VTPNSQVELEEAMMFMHQSPNEAIKMGLLAKQRFDSMFDVTLMAQSYIKLYQSMISDKNLSHNAQSNKPKGGCSLLRGINK
jgi:glycosyltransferase involved in cell wall biosynthesis